MEIFGDQFRKTRMNLALMLMAAAGLMLAAPGETADEFIHEHFDDTRDLVFTNKGPSNDTLMLFQAEEILDDGATVGAWYQGFDENRDSIIQKNEITRFGFWAKNMYDTRSCDYIVVEKNKDDLWDIRKEYHVKDDVVEQSNEKNIAPADLIHRVLENAPRLKRHDPSLRIA